MVVTKETASQWSLKAIPDLAAHQAELPSPRRPSSRPASRAWSVSRRSTTSCRPSSARSRAQATVEALKNGQVKAANIFSTDPSIVAERVRRARGPEAASSAPTTSCRSCARTRSTTRSRRPSTRSRPRSTRPALADMVKQVVVDKKDASVVAKWLISAGLI